MDTLDIKTIAPAQSRKNRVVPQGYTVFEELGAVQQLMDLDRTDEARERLDILLRRNEAGLRRLDPYAWSFRW